MGSRTQHQDRNHCQRGKLSRAFCGRFYTKQEEHCPNWLFESVREVLHNGKQMFANHVFRRDQNRGG